jgi:hypothetical protein
MASPISPTECLQTIGFITKIIDNMIDATLDRAELLSELRNISFELSHFTTITEEYILNTNELVNWNNVLESFNASARNFQQKLTYGSRQQRRPREDMNVLERVHFAFFQNSFQDEIKKLKGKMHEIQMLHKS